MAASGFVRRFPYMPPDETIRAIEGVVIVDNAPPGTIEGVGTGCVCAVGEFTDCSYAIQADALGVITSSPRPVEVFGGQDLIDKVGGWDETLGKFGAECGNGFAALRNKTFVRLVVVPVDVVTPGSGSCYGTRYWRELPTNISATNANPIVPVAAAAIEAGREFRSGANRVRVAKRVVFSNAPAYLSALDGAVTNAAAAATQTFDAASGDFVVNGVMVGDLLVVGSLNAPSGANLTNAGTYRITAITDADTLVVEKLDGTNFAWTTGTALAWRIHPAAAGDSAGSVGTASVALSGVAGYVVPARPLTATVAAATLLTPAVAPAANSGSAWDTLAGLTGRTHPSGTLTYDANVHAPNAANNSTLEARYTAAILATMDDNDPAGSINIIVAARKSSTIRTQLRAHVLEASARGLTRRTILAPSLVTQSVDTACGNADPGVGANRSERVDYAWPGGRTYVPEAVNFSVAGADGLLYTDGVMDDPCDFWLASVESNLPPERNPAQAAEPVPTILSRLLGYQRTTSPIRLSQPEYTRMRAAGVVGLRVDRILGPQFQSGVTTSLVAKEKNILRRRMADYIQDSITQYLAPIVKLPLTQRFKDSCEAVVVGFMRGLLSPDNPAAQRIDGYTVDVKNGNTPNGLAKGIFVIKGDARLTPTGDFLVLSSDISETTVVTTVS